MNATVAFAVVEGVLRLVATYGPEALALINQLRKSDPQKPIEQVLAEWAVNATSVKALEDEIKARHNVQ